MVWPILLRETLRCLCTVCLLELVLAFILDLLKLPWSASPPRCPPSGSRCKYTLLNSQMASASMRPASGMSCSVSDSTFLGPPNQLLRWSAICILSHTSGFSYIYKKLFESPLKHQNRLRTRSLVTLVLWILRSETVWMNKIFRSRKRMEVLDRKRYFPHLSEMYLNFSILYWLGS